MQSPHHKSRTLLLVGALHACTHVYQVALLPLYLPIQKDLRLDNVGQSTLLVTVMMAAYFLPSYPMGMLADRCSRKRLLAWGLLINALGFLGLAFASNYAAALACVIVAGVGGSFFHPAATALVARLYPEATGRALGLIGVGASVGFLAGPLYAGWRAAQTGNWRAPVLELGLFGIVAAGAFAWLAEEAPVAARERADGETHADSGAAVPAASVPPASRLQTLGSPSETLGGLGQAGTPAPLPRPAPARLFPTPALWACFLTAAFAFSLRDFAGSSMGSLGSLFLQHAHGFTVRETGFALSGIFLLSVVSNPLFGHFSDRGRKRWTTLVLLIAAVMIALFPRLPRAWLAPALVLYGFFFIANYPMVEAALMEAVPDAVRGRVFGLFITIGGLLGNLSHWVAGHWVKQLGAKAGAPETYHGYYLLLAALVLVSLLGLPCLQEIRNREHSRQS